MLGSRIVSSWADAALARAAQDVLMKIDAVLPPQLKNRFADSPLHVPDFHVPGGMKIALAPLRSAIALRSKVFLEYVRADEQPSERVILPLGLFYWGATWTLAAWCELRDDFRNFRLDRIQQLAVLKQTFTDEPGRTLAAVLAHPCAHRTWVSCPPHKCWERRSCRHTRTAQHATSSPLKIMILNC